MGANVKEVSRVPRQASALDCDSQPQAAREQRTEGTEFVILKVELW